MYIYICNGISMLFYIYCNLLVFLLYPIYIYRYIYFFGLFFEYHFSHRYSSAFQKDKQITQCI